MKWEHVLAIFILMLMFCDVTLSARATLLPDKKASKSVAVFYKGKKVGLSYTKNNDETNDDDHDDDGDDDRNKRDESNPQDNQESDAGESEDLDIDSEDESPPTARPVRGRAKIPSETPLSLKHGRNPDEKSQEMPDSDRFDKDSDKFDKDRDKFDKDNLHKEHRLVDTTAASSIELVILVVGGVIGCVILTGFIRWRIKSRLLARQMKAIEEFSFMGDLKRQHWRITKMEKTMDTIYEENTFEEGQEMLCVTDSDHPRVASGDANTCTLQIIHTSMPSPREKRVERLGPGHTLKSHKYMRREALHEESKRYKRSDKRLKSHRHRHRRTESMTPTLESVPEPKDQEQRENSGSSEPLLSGDVNIIMEEGTDPQIPPPPLLQHRNGNSSQGRGLLSSLLSTWHSLSFNRDWVGRMWQERHNVRRISDVLRGGLNDRECSEDESTNDSTEKDTTDGSGSTSSDPDREAKEAESNQAQFATEYSHTVDESQNVETSDNVRSTDDNVNEFYSSDTQENEAERTRLSSFSSVRGTPCHREAAPQDSTISRSCPDFPAVGNDATNRHRQRNRRSEGRRRTLRHYFHRTYDLGEHHRNNAGQNSRNIPQVHNTNFSRPNMTCDVNTERQPQLRTTPITTSPNLRSPEYRMRDRRDAHQSQYINNTDSFSPVSSSPLSQYINNTDSFSPVSSSPLSSSYPLQDGVLIEQLSDGGQIIYVPPPTLPSYHNDTPPPYHV